MTDPTIDNGLHELLHGATAIARRAGDCILEIYRRDFTVTDKDDRSPLTEADMASHRLICDNLARFTPAIPLLSEESSGIPYPERRTWQRYWLIDPLDGTREFIKKNGEFTVNIALIENGEPVLGVVHVPVSGVSYTAARGLGAEKQGADSAPESIHVRTTTCGNFVIAGSRSHGSERQARFIQALGKNTEVMAIGSSLKFCLVAEGRVDIYPRFGPTSEWDTAAAHCVVLEAGGSVTDTEFRPLRYNTGESLLNPDFLVIGDTGFDWRPYLDRVTNSE